MEAMISSRGVPWYITKSCPISGPGPQPTHRSCLTPVPRKFDDFFDLVRDKPTDLDAPEPEWKYLSGFPVR